MADDPRSPLIPVVGGDAPGDESLMGPLRLALYAPVREYPPLGDRKALAVLATNGLMLTVALFFSAAINAMVEGDDRFGFGRYVTVIALVPFGVGMFWGTWAAFRALTLPMPKMPETLALFGDIARLDREEYRRRVLAVDYADALRAMLHYNYSLATLSASKFRLLNRAILCSKIMFPLWMALLLVLTALRG